jgi:hypothetical protein
MRQREPMRLGFRVRWQELNAATMSKARPRGVPSRSGFLFVHFASGGRSGVSSPQTTKT